MEQTSKMIQKYETDLKHIKDLQHERSGTWPCSLPLQTFTDLCLRLRIIFTLIKTVCSNKSSTFKHNFTSLIKHLFDILFLDLIHQEKLKPPLNLFMSHGTCSLA